MKKIILTMVPLFCLTCFLNAQQVVPGFKGGFNAADLTNMSGDSRISAHVGLFVHVRMNSKWAFQPEFEYSWEGQRYFTGGREYTLALNYIHVPFMFQYYPIRQFYLELGPQLGFLTSAKVKGNGYKADVFQGYRKTDIGLNLGMGVNATDRLGFYARYCIGLRSISPDNTYSYYNRVFQLGASARLK